MSFLIDDAQRQAEKDLDALAVAVAPAQGSGGSVSARTDGVNGKAWDRLTLLTGGFVEVGSIFWARPPKLLSQQKIMLAMQEADAIPDTANVIESAIGRMNIFLKLATELFYVREDQEFRPATEAEVGGDEYGLDANEIRDALYRLMGIEPDTPGGNA